MKVAMVFDGLGTGGIERVGIGYAHLLKAMGHEIDIYNLQPECCEMENSYADLGKIRHKKIPFWMIPDQYILMVKRWWWGKYVYPVVYPLMKVMLFLYRITMGKRESYDLAIAFSGHLRDLNFVSCNYVKSNKKMCWLHGALMEYLVSASTFGDQYRKIKNLCVLSEANQASALFMNRYLTNLNIQLIYNPIDLKEKPIDWNHVKELQEIYGEFALCAARFGVDKDQKSVIHAVKLLKEKGNTNVKVVFAGAGDTLEECKKLAENLQVEENVIFAGNRTDMADYYAAAKLLVHSSPAEGLPTVILEAMKYDLPVVATHSMPGVEEILKGDMYGLQCEVGNPEDIADKWEKMLLDESLRKHYIEQGRVRVRDFSCEKIEERLTEIFDKMQ